MRTSGNLKVILNSSLVVGMSFSKSNEKSLRFTNVDGIYTVKVTIPTVKRMMNYTQHFPT